MKCPIEIIPTVFSATTQYPKKMTYHVSGQWRSGCCCIHIALVGKTHQICQMKNSLKVSVNSESRLPTTSTLLPLLLM